MSLVHEGNTVLAFFLVVAISSNLSTWQIYNFLSNISKT